MHERFANVGPDAVPFRPRWLRLVPFLVYAPPLTPRQWQVLGLITAASLFDRYDLALFSLALKQIQTGLGIAKRTLARSGLVSVSGRRGRYSSCWRQIAWDGGVSCSGPPRNSTFCRFNIQR